MQVVIDYNSTLLLIWLESVPKKEKDVDPEAKMVIFKELLARS